MRFERPEKLATVLSVIIAVMVISAMVQLSLWYKQTPVWYPILGAGIIIGGISFILIRFGLYQFIYEKVKVIYKNIHELKVGSEYDEEQVARTSDLDMVEQEVSEWAEERRAEIKELKERETFRREFIGNVSHELKTPIFNIQGYILTLLDGAIEDPEINVKYLKRANKSVERMINLVQDMDMLNKLESGVLEIKMQNFNLAQLVRDVFEMLEEKARNKNIILKINPPSEKPVMVVGDPGRIEQVLINLVNNAIKYGKKGGKVEVRFYDMDDKILTEVSDDGIGIPEEDIPRIFERFYRVDKSRTREAGGSGLGLAIVKHIIDQHKQTINVRSSANMGSTFSFTLKKGK
ncbi:MAG: sensor histidine kinase [Bacteroidota bacterium]|nr:sensor histidine kinase [Bacteroidota bacterium]MDX5428040.1 sensor histidine kinase [Bacteroidota bacterium]MDX5447688.1 sensor histidine kinase [Bacteroidota bacterium]MDX5505877.1 sensor histidine kinase [Bacteroidota bacterium]